MIQSCHEPSATFNLDRINWLEGSWRSKNETGFFENWEIAEKNRMTGIGFTMENSDTLMTEHLEIYVSDSGTFYKALVSDQNDRLPVLFKLNHAENDSLVFANPSHDFPRFIVYKKFDNNSFKAYVRDGFEESSRGFDLLMHRIDN